MNVTFGLDIGTTTLKAVQLKREGNGSLLIDAVVVSPNNTKGILSENLADQQNLATAIKTMLDDGGFKSKDVNISLPESQVYTKIVEMPLLTESELSAALKWEMEQYIPLPLDQVKTDWQVLKRVEDKQRKMYVLLVAAPIVILDKYEKILNITGLNPINIETEIISVHRSLLPLVSGDDANLIIHLGAAASIIAIAKSGILQMVFSLGLGGTAITRAIASDLGIDMTQAENFKRAYGLNKEAFEGKIGKTLQPILESITGDVRKALMLYREKSKEEIKQIILSGGTALLPGIDAYFTNVLGTQIVIGNCWELNGITNAPDEIRVDAPGFNVVAGLALRDFV